MSEYISFEAPYGIPVRYTWGTRREQAIEALSFQKEGLVGAVGIEPTTLRLPKMHSREDLIIYNFIYIYVDEKPEGTDKSLKRMVGASGFEPPASWSRTRRASQAALRPDNRNPNRGKSFGLDDSG
jgi:hypothetical protein